MLYLTRKIGESIVINDDIELTVIEVRGRSVKLGFTFPPTVSVLRREIFERIQEENRAAAASNADIPEDGLGSLSGAAPRTQSSGGTQSSGD